MIVNKIFLDPSNTDFMEYGSEVYFHSVDCVVFKNKNLYAGQTIVTWTTLTEFWKTSLQNPLPMLYQGEKYQLKVCYLSNPSNRLYVKITFYDRYKERIDYLVLKQKVNTFTVPENTVHYQIELVNGGIEYFEFYQLEINRTIMQDNQYLLNDDDLKIETFSTPDDSDSTLNIVFTEPRMLAMQTIDFLNPKNVIQIANSKALSHFYLNDGQVDNRITELLKNLIDEYVIDKMIFIGCGPISNFASQIYAKCITDVPVEVYLANHSPVHYPMMYQKIVGFDQFRKWLENKDNVTNDSNVFFYGVDGQNSFLPDVNSEQRLKLCPALRGMIKGSD